MKKLFYAFIMFSFFLFSCGGSTEQTSESSDEAVMTEQSEEGTEVEDQAIEDCDDFLDNYEQWVDEYLEVVEAYFKDPANTEVNEKYVKLTESMTIWARDWTNMVECAAKEKYQQRFDEIGSKLEKGLDELGLGN